MNDETRSRVRIHRRRWLALGLAGVVTSWAKGDEPEPEGDARELAEVRALARRANLGEFRASTSRLYLAIGDAPDSYRDGAARLCDDLAAVFLRHFASKGFELAPPPRRLTIVTLADVSSYARFSRDERPGPYGQYDGASNRLLVYDLRTRKDALPQRADVLNRQVLIHEAQHQLAFNTGLLRDPRANHLRALVEGLAIYGETYRGGDPSTLGETHPDRLRYLSRRLRQGSRWLDAETLLADNSAFSDPSEASICQAYAQSWLLVHDLLTEPALVPRFRAYLADYGRAAPPLRLELARRHLGNLAQLDQAARRRLGL